MAACAVPDADLHAGAISALGDRTTYGMIRIA